MGTAEQVYEVHTSQFSHPVFVRGGNSTDAMVLYELIAMDEYGILGELDSPKSIIDGGANIGLTSAYLLARYPTARTIAVEPFEDTLNICRKNLAAYKGRAQILPKAIWSQDGYVMLDPKGEEWANQVRSPQAGEAGGVSAVAMSTLVELCGGSVDLLKLDVEGGEKEIFKPGMTSWLSSVRNILIELHDQECIDRFFAAMAPYDYELSNHDRVYCCRNLRLRAAT